MLAVLSDRLAPLVNAPPPLYTHVITYLHLHQRLGYYNT